MERKKSANSHATSSTIHLEGWIRCFRHRRSIKISENKMDSKVSKSHQCSLERFHAVSIEFNSEF